MNKDKILHSKEKLEFLEDYSDLNDSETLKEILYYQKLQLKKMEQVRTDTSKLVWWLIAIPIIVTILFFIYAYSQVG
ncbi:hypothetical protein [Pontimicrobium sp. IMCC45349]|uniref:hypothetical protein n=1 Tax=Pontimicrobium sp. IMCC45349 TaxID=3391574 RepID=UPI00399FA029